MDTSSFGKEAGLEAPDDNHTSSERLQILQMIEDGKITPEQGANLLAALDAPRGEDRSPSPAKSGGPKWFRVRVTDLVTGKAKATVNIPLGLMDWGLKIGAQFAPQVSDVNLTQLGEALRSGVEGKIIDVVDEEDGEHVEIFVE
jgi:hypothetical protein